MTYPIPPPTSGAVTKFHPSVARCKLRTPLRIFRSLDFVVFFACGPRPCPGEGSEAIPSFSPDEKLRQRNLRAGTYQHKWWVSREVRGLDEKKSYRPHEQGFSIVHKALRRKGIYFKNVQYFIEKHREFIDIYRIVQYFRIALSGGGSTDPRRGFSRIMRMTLSRQMRANAGYPAG